MTDEIAQKAKSPIGKYVPLVVVGLVLLIGWLSGWHEYFTLTSLIQNREMFGQMIADNLLLASLAYLCLYAFLVAISFPGASLLTVGAGLLFGAFLGGALTVVAATAGAVVIFMIARSSFGDFLQAKAGPFMNRMIDGFQNDAFQYLLTIRLTPVFPFWVVNIVPALLNMKVTPYAVATFLGIIPGTFVYAYIGAGLDSIIAAQQAADPGCVAAGTCTIDPKSLVTKEILLAMAGLAFISILPLVIRKFKSGN